MSQQKQYKVYPKCPNPKCEDGFIPVKVGASMIMYELCPNCTIIKDTLTKPAPRFNITNNQPVKKVIKLKINYRWDW